MSLEQSIADLQTQAGLLLDLPQQIRDEAVGQIGNISDTYDEFLEKAMITVYLDQENGSDANSGITSSEPLASVAQAVALCPRKGEVRIILINDYTFDESVTIQGKTVVFESQGSEKHNLHFEMYVTTTSTFKQRYGINVDAESFLFFNKLTVHVGELSSGKSVGYSSAPIKDFPARSSGIVKAKFSGCVMVRPAANAWSPLIAAREAVVILSASVTESDQSMDGWWWQGAMTPTDPATLNNVVTNLTSL